jgi:hypothetical protein
VIITGGIRRRRHASCDEADAIREVALAHDVPSR